MIRAILLGAGRAGAFHANSLRTSTRYQAVCVVDRDTSRATALADALGCPTASDAAEAFARHDADVVIVATTTHTHTELVQASLSAGFHVFCEKPLGTLDQVCACYRLSRSRNRSLMVGFQRRFDPEFRELRRRLGSQSPQMLKLTSRDAPIPSRAYLATSGGIVRDCVVHDIDIANWMMGGEASHAVPERVSAASYTHHDDLTAWGEIEGLAVTMQYPHGNLALIDVSRTCCYGYDQRVEAFGPFGMAQLGNRLQSTVVQHTSDGTVVSNPLYSFPQRYPDAYRIELEHFADVVEGKAQCQVLEKQVVATEMICEAIEASLESGAFCDVRNVDA